MDGLGRNCIRYCVLWCFTCCRYHHVLCCVKLFRMWLRCGTHLTLRCCCLTSSVFLFVCFCLAVATRHKMAMLVSWSLYTTLLYLNSCWQDFYNFVDIYGLQMIPDFFCEPLIFCVASSQVLPRSTSLKARFVIFFLGELTFPLAPLSGLIFHNKYQNLMSRFLPSNTACAFLSPTPQAKILKLH